MTLSSPARPFTLERKTGGLALSTPPAGQPCLPGAGTHAAARPYDAARPRHRTPGVTLPWGRADNRRSLAAVGVAYPVRGRALLEDPPELRAGGIP